MALQAVPNLQPPHLMVHGDTCIVTDANGQQARLAPYTYGVLPTRRTIRLLRAGAGATPPPPPFSSQVRTYELVEYDLPNTSVAKLDVSSSPYVAMSYCWGSAHADAPLLVTQRGQDRVLRITAKAWEAICRTAPAIALRGKAMWIDQVCIDQENEPEREQQVGLMGEIYRRCWHCMIWLGPASARTHLAYDLLHRLHAAVNQYQPLPIAELPVADLSHAQIRHRLSSAWGEDRLPPASDPGWVEVARLLERGWFLRTWTFQEAVLCYEGDASFRCGHYNIPYKTFTRAAFFLGDQWTPGGIDFAGVKFATGRQRLRQMAFFRDFITRRDPIPLLKLLPNNLFAKCQKPHDRIFAFLGLRIEEVPLFSVAINYRQPPQDLYMDVARKMIRAQKNLRVCAEAPERAADADGLNGLPSWVPDWSRIPLTTTFELLDVQQPSYFNACNGRRHSDADEVTDANILTVEGKIVDRVVDLIEVEIPNDVSPQARQEVLTTDAIPLLMGILRSYAAETMSDAKLAHKIIRTMTLNGYTRDQIFGDTGLPPEAWTETTCSQMVQTSTSGLRLDRAPVSGIDASQWWHSLTRQALQCVNRRFALLEKNVLGLVPRSSRDGDLIVVLHGSTLPFVMRREEPRGCRLVGVCFVDGIMHGETVNWDVADKFDLC